MSEFQLTASQQQAVDLQGQSLLVSAAAGSGKTRVLTERLCARVVAGENIDRFLVITFTRAAAAELKGRILQELNDLTAQNPQDKHLRRQSALLYRAQIGTIDSFCTAVVRENAHRLGISPGFTVLDEERCQSMLARALEDVLDDAYETIEDDPGLEQLVNSVGAGRDDSRLAELVRQVYAQLQSRAWPEKWAQTALEALNVAGITDAGQTPWGSYLLADAAQEAGYWAEEVDKATAVMTRPENEPLWKGYGEAFQWLGQVMRDVVRSSREGWDKTTQVLSQEVPRLGAVRKFEDEGLKKQIQAVWNGGKKALQKMQKTLAGDSASLLAGVRRSKPAMEALMRLVFSLDKAYEQRKHRADACDFSDVEHLCLKLLCDEQTAQPTVLAGEISNRFAEVMVDEYQDVNAVQELIFQRVSGEGERLFMVGDVKQSIYRFRLADPTIFNEKFQRFQTGQDGTCVLLRENFRSRRSVLDACNAVFEAIMSPALGEIVYDEQARLVCGASYPAEGEVKPELCILDPVSPDEEETPDKRRAEAQYVAERIQAMVASGTPVSDGKGGTRPMTYGDVAVILRTPNTSGSAYRQALVEKNIPVTARQGSNFFDQPEVNFALSMLAVADNPRQDVPLIAALRGLPFGFTPDELSAIRGQSRGDFWDALCQREQEDEKCRRFVALVEQLRDLAREEPTETVLRWLYDRTGLMAACAASPDAQRRTGCLMQLYEYARQFEQDGNRGLFRFVSWLKELESRGMEPPSPSSGGAVEILSVHKSKGLEFPVVFLVDNSHRWNNRGGGRVLCHSQLGLGMRLTDSQRGVEWPTLPYRAIAQKIRQEELSEQERVLYVAMTRAKERLIMTCVLPKAEEKLAELRPTAHVPVSPRLLATASDTAKWLQWAALADGGRTIDLHIVKPPEKLAAATAEKTSGLGADPALVAELRQRLSWQYPYEGAVSLPSKLTATEVKGLTAEEADPEAANLTQQAATSHRRFRVPKLGREETALTGAERGVAEHLVMQYIDFSQTDSLASIAQEIARLQEQGFLDRRQAESVPPEDIWAFFQSDIGQRLKKADKVIREFKFSLLCPAQTWFSHAPAGEEILLQGVVDCCIQERDKLTVIDFKTDAQVHPELYTPQLAAYAMAMERIFQKPVQGAVLWYLRKKQAVAVALSPENPAFAEKTVALSDKI
jgi:ATP-dependent helicase/nuclease subunit A